MEGIRFVTDDQNRRVAVQIDLKLIEEQHEDVADFFDGLIAELRRNEEKIPFEEVVSNLRKARQ